MKAKPYLLSILGLLAAGNASQGQATWNGATSTDWADATNWSTDPELPASGAEIIIADTTTNHLTLDSSRTIGSFTFGDTGTRNTNFIVTTGAANTLTVNGGLSALANISTTARPTFVGNVTIGAAQAWEINGASYTIISNALGNGTLVDSGNFTLNANLTKTGTGALNVQRANSSGSGDFIVNEGGLRFAANSSVNIEIGGTGKIIVNNDAHLALLRNSGSLQITRDIQMNDTSDLVWRGPSSGTDTISANIAWNGTHDMAAAQSNPLIFDGAWTGAGAITLTGTASPTIAGDLSGFTGTINFNGGINILSSDLANATQVSMNGTGSNAIRLDLNGVTVDTDIVLNQTAVTSTKGVINATNSSVINGDILVTAAPTGSGAGGHLFTESGRTLTLNGTLNVDGAQEIITQRGGTVVYAGGGSTNFRLNISSIARLGADNGLSQGAVANIGHAATGTLNLIGYNQTLRGITKGANAANITNTGATLAVLTLNDSAEDFDYAGTIDDGTGGIAIVKKGSNTVTLSGANTYTGDTTVEAGTLTLDTAYLADTSAVRITTGAVLNLSHGETDTVAELWVDGVKQPDGLYTPSESFIDGTGSLLVNPPSSSAYDAWLISAGLTPGDPETGANESYDQSGVANIVQFALGGDVLDPADNGIREVFSKDASNAPNLVLTIAVRDGATFAGSPSPIATIDGINYTIQGGTDLQSFTTQVEEVALTNPGAITPPTGYTLKSFRLVQAPALSSKGFLRVEVAQP